MEVCARIQAHPSRRHLHQTLADALGVPSQVCEHTSDPPSPWEGYKRCLRNLPDVTHILVIQDDAIPCRNFGEALPKIARNEPVCLFLARLPRRTSTDAGKAIKQGRRYVTVHFYDFCPVVAMLWPVEKAREFMEWAEKDPALPGQPNPRSDDAVVGHWMRKTRQTVYATVPSLVDHRAGEPSVKGAENAASSFTAAHLASDALDYDWTS